VGYALPSPCVLALAQLVLVVRGLIRLFVDGLQSVQPRLHLKEDFVYQFTFCNVPNDGILITIFYLAVFKAMFVNVLILVVAVLR
jgi:hypothetical protein